MAYANRTLRNLHLLQELIKREEALDEVVEAMVSKLLDYEIGRLEEYRSRLKGKLEAFETKYGLSTEEFSWGFREGRMGDAMDFFEWLALAEIYEDVSKALAEVEKAHDGIHPPLAYSSMP